MARNLEKKLSVSILTIFILIFCLSVTTIALIYASVTLDNNTIETGYIAISLNDGNPIISEGEFNFEPGATIQKNFTLKNTSPCSIWYRFYFKIDYDNIVGKLQDALEITIKDGETVLYEGLMTELEKDDSKKAPMNETELEENETRTFTITFHLPEDVDNNFQGAELPFDFIADAVQTKNNPNRLFNN